MKTKKPQCNANIRIQNIDSPVYSCVLRKDHDNPFHKFEVYYKDLTKEGYSK